MMKAHTADPIADRCKTKNRFRPDFLRRIEVPLRFGERTRLGCWRQRPADASESLGETPRAACGTQALPGKLEDVASDNLL
jgi:hypothetical protein